ncbi:YkvA family protein [Sporomusa sp.]|uniref:YkvA family protein n=1 Tax=Sporomusa sp. TaxID=2078658 RepID=UPI0039C95F17
MEHEKTNEQELTLNQRLKHWARTLKSNIITIYFALKHPQTPVYAKVFIAIIVGYALSPIDLIPDFIPVFGYIDDVILLPLGIALAIKLIPTNVFNACREEARNNPPVMKPKIWVAAYVIAILWLVVLYALYELIR